MLIHFLEAWSLLGAVHFICQHILEVWLIIGLCLTKIYSMPCIQPYTFWGIEIWLLYGPLQVPCLEAWLLIGTCLLIGTKEYRNALSFIKTKGLWNITSGLVGYSLYDPSFLSSLDVKQRLGHIALWERWYMSAQSTSSTISHAKIKWNSSWNGAEKKNCDLVKQREDQR